MAAEWYPAAVKTSSAAVSNIARRSSRGRRALSPLVGLSTVVIAHIVEVILDIKKDQLRMRMICKPESYQIYLIGAHSAATAE
jgi:hypothetical protein